MLRSGDAVPSTSVVVLLVGAVVLGLSLIYAAFGQVPLIAALFTGVQAAVIAIVVEAL